MELNGMQVMEANGLYYVFDSHGELRSIHYLPQDGQYMANFKTMDFITKKATKGVKSKKGSNAYYEKAGKQITEKFVDTAASIVGFSTTAAGLAVDKDNNGKSDVLEVGNKKREREAITDLAGAVLDAI